MHNKVCLVLGYSVYLKNFLVLWVVLTGRVSLSRFPFRLAIGVELECRSVIDLALSSQMKMAAVIRFNQ